MQPQAGPKIVDFATHFSGPLAAVLLAELGADVIKVENPTVGDGNRGVGPMIAGESMAHIALNRGKRSLAISPHSPQWPDVVRRCAAWADAVIVSGQPAALEKRGLTFEALVDANPQLVYCTVTGYGESGPWREFPSHGLNTDAWAGLVPVDWSDCQPGPRRDYRSAGTTLAGLHAALGISAALYRRDHGGGPQRVSVSIWESAMWWSWRDVATRSNLGEPWLAYRDLGSRYAMYRTADERAVLVCPAERRFWTAFCELLDLPDQFARRGDWGESGMDWGETYDDERIAIAERIAQRSLDVWADAFARAEIPFAPMLTLDEALASEQARAVGVLAETEVNGQRVTVARTPITIAAPDAPQQEPLLPAPALGAHTDELLQELGSFASAGHGVT
jgi:crotonobetainyl-CoA:carnitine CoA-transferase CaiB-like acyl-CoA transferase